MGEAHRRSALVASFGLSLVERLLLLKTWVLPVLLLMARAYRATEQEERSLKVVFNTALGFDSWGTTLSQASLHPDDGGFSLPPPPPHLAQGAGGTGLYGIRSDSGSHAELCAIKVSSMGYQIRCLMAPEVLTFPTARSCPILHNGIFGTIPKVILTGQTLCHRWCTGWGKHQGTSSVALYYFPQFRQPHLLLPSVDSQRGHVHIRLV